MSTSTQITEKQARAVAEEAREAGWDRPSFCKELFLGMFPLELIHPHPRPDPADAAAGAAFLDRLRAYCASIDGGAIEREARIPDECVQGLAELERLAALGVSHVHGQVPGAVSIAPLELLGTRVIPVVASL